MRRLTLSLMTLLLLVLPASPASGPATAQAPDPAALGDRMVDASERLLASFEARLRDQATFAFDGEARLDWHYVPRERPGVPLGSMTDEQRSVARELLHAGLGDGGMEKADGVMTLEAVLYESSGRRPMRDPGNYAVVFFGEPAAAGPWGWRFEGHHLSLNFTLLDGRLVSATPAFFGANPAEVREGPRAGLRVLATEEDLAFRLVRSFTGTGRDRVIIEAEAPRDILTTNAPRAEMGAPAGVALADMDAGQRDVFLDLLATYVRRFHPDLGEAEMARIRDAGLERLHFAWAGETEPGRPHYYRIHGPTFVVELDNTQNDANHIHSVWRDFERDFGHDPLRAHLTRDHGLKIAAAGQAPGLRVDGAGAAAAGGTEHSHGTLRHRH